MNPNPTTFDVPSGLSNLLSAYDEGHWETVVAELKPASGVLLRGSVLAAVTGKLELVSATNQASVYGVLLDEQIDTAAPFSDGSVSASVARAGSFRGPALIVATGVDGIALANALRDIGIFVHGPITIPAATQEASAQEREEREREKDEKRR